MCVDIAKCTMFIRVSAYFVAYIIILGIHASLHLFRLKTCLSLGWESQHNQNSQDTQEHKHQN